MDTGTFDYAHGDVTCEAFAAYDNTQDGKRPCVLVVHQWAGQSEAERGAARRLAELGYVAIAIDVYGKGRRGDLAGDNTALMQPFLEDRALLRDRLIAAVTAAKAHPAVDPERIAAMGYCFGGLCVLDMARSGTPDIKGVASIHGIFPPPNLERQGPITAKVLILHGWEDPLAPPPDVIGVAKELTDAGADWQLHAYGHARHAFTNKAADAPDQGMQYNEAAARRSWSAMTAFLAEVLA
ncbi:dienelactone hydrolase family protein [Iodidimonas sp. SYSU 1G8]|uniref:dienelactone hydrolase family protein n=1 Tax=Iodidimonas sp. SYSU 1G8 TaxID=3133967 RepID=UPI0031FE7ADF